MVLVETALLVDDGGDGAASPSPTQPCIDLVENYVFWNHPEKGEKNEMSSQFDFVYVEKRRGEENIFCAPCVLCE